MSMQLSLKATLLLSAMRFLELSTKYITLGYLPQTLHKFGVLEDQLALYQAVIFNVYVGATIIACLFYGIVLDILNTRRLIIAQCFTIGIALLVFGCSSSPRMLLATRFLVGCVNGLSITLKVYVKEMNVGPRGLVLVYAAPISLSLALAPLIGGVLSLPCQQYPHIFPADSIFDQMPTLLPNVLVAGLLFVVGIAGIYMLSDQSNQRSHEINEQLLLVCKETESQNISTTLDPTRHDCPIADRPWQVLHVKNVKHLLNRSFVFSMLAFVFFWTGIALFYTFLSLWIGSPTAMLGMGYAPKEMSHIFCWPGFAALVIDLTVVAEVNERLGPRKAFTVWSFTMMFMTSVIVNTAVMQDKFRFVITMIVLLTVQRSASSGCSSAVVPLVNNSLPTSVLGIGNALTMIIGSLSVLLVSPLTGSLYTWSIHNDKKYDSQALGFPFNQYLIFYVTGIILGMSGICSIFTG